MKILLCAADDWSNLMRGHANALRSVGIDATDLKLKPHVFGYDDASPVVKAGEMMAAMCEADIVMIYHSARSIVNLIRNSGIYLLGKVVVVHTGSDYRNNPDEVRALFQSIGVVCEFTDQCEFLMIDPALKYVAAAVPEHKKPIPAPNEFPVKVAHYPSKSEVKGTADIIRMMEKFQDKCYFKMDTELVPHAQQLQRLQACDIYVELFKLELNGQPYGCFGVTAFEAAALGKVVVTNNIYKEAYESVYGECELVIANTEEGFNTYMADLLSMTPDQLYEKRNATLNWVIRNHSYEATGNRIKNILAGL